MSPQRKGMQIGGAISAALCAAFIMRWWMVPTESAWRLTPDGAAWEATRDVNGAVLLPERKYSVEGSCAAPAKVSWIMRATDGPVDERSGEAGSVTAGRWAIAVQAGPNSPRRAAVTIRVSPAEAIEPNTLKVQLAR